MADLTLYFNPRSRAVIAYWMLEEVGADYALETLDFDKGEHKTPAYLAINPMGKVPALVTPGGTVITEAPAIIAWLADAYPAADLAPAVGSDARGTYYRWLFFGGSAFEPALIEKMMRADAEPLSPSTVGWGSYEHVVSTLETSLADRPYLLGERFSAADVYVGSELAWAKSFKAPLLDSPAIAAYLGRIAQRPAFRKAMGGFA